MAERKRVGIVGAGYTGLAAAYYLSQKGAYDIRVYDAASEAGGLAVGYKVGDTSLEKAYHHLFKSDTAIRELVKELGIESKLEWLPSSTGMVVDGRVYPFMTPMDILRFTPLSFVNRVRLGLVAFYLQQVRRWRPLADVSAAAWLKRAAGENAYNVVWKPLLVGKFSKWAEHISMAWLWARIHTRLSSREIGAREKLGYFNGGFQIVTEALMKAVLARGVSVQFGVRISSITKKDDTWRIQMESGEKEFDAVIITTPAHRAAAMLANETSLPADYRAALTAPEYEGAVLLIFTTEQDLSEFYWLTIADLSLPFLVFIHHTRLVPKERYGGKHVYYIGTYVPHDHRFFSQPPEQTTGEWFTALSRVFPQFKREKVEQHDLFQFRNAQHIPTVGYEKTIPPHKAPVPGLYIANFSQIFPEDRGTNFAVRDGRRVAELVHEYFAT